MTWLCRIASDTTSLLTRRCTLRRFTIAPRSMVPSLFGNCVGLTAERHGTLPHANTCISKPWRAAVADPGGHITELSRDIHSLGARALKAHLGRWEALGRSQRLSLVELLEAPPRQVIDLKGEDN